MPRDRLVLVEDKGGHEIETDAGVFDANPVFRVPIEDAYIGGSSDPRNGIMMKMFNLVNIGERAGSGVPNMVED